MILINKDNYDKEIKENSQPVLLGCTAKWCIPCKQMTKILEELEIEQNEVKIAKLNVEESPEIAAELGILNIPVLVYFKDGQPVDRIVGIKSKKAVIKMISQ